jgi:hypothetical protein
VGAQTVFQAAYHLPLVFERLRSFDVQFEGEKGDQGKWSVIGRRSSANPEDGRPTTDDRF